MLPDGLRRVPEARPGTTARPPTPAGGRPPQARDGAGRRPASVGRVTEAERDAIPLDSVGVGPWEGPWPGDPRHDPELLAGGDRRNVVDRYRYWTVEAIVADLDTRRHPFHVAIENWRHDLNIGTVVRTANAFLAAEVHVVGRRRWNRRGAMVTDRYQHVRHHPDVTALVAWARSGGLPLLAVDNLPGARPLETEPLPRACVLLFGQEGTGLSEEARAAADGVLSIAQFGSTRSINAGVAAGIAMHAWIRQHADPDRP
jgi:tRNA(Leu) C34 or U34 (ribose-2'-O)-methylase TrmL